MLETGDKVKYLGHIIRDDLSDDDAIQGQCYKLCAQANILPIHFICALIMSKQLFLKPTALHSTQHVCGVAIVKGR